MRRGSIVAEISNKGVSAGGSHLLLYISRRLKFAVKAMMLCRVYYAFRSSEIRNS